MSAPTGEGGLLPINSIPHVFPKFHLLEPTAAPEDMLAAVRVNTEARCLEAATPIGTVAVEMYWTTNKNPDHEERGDFFSALSPDFDPSASDNPLPTQQYPYTVLPDGALYEAVVRAPIEAVDAKWSEPQLKVVGNEGKNSIHTGTSLFAFRQAFPDVTVDLPEGRYTITTKEQTAPTLAIAARVENGEPLVRRKRIIGDRAHYYEVLANDFLASGLRPDTAVSLINSRTTIRENTGEADSQRLEFAFHDGFQRTGEGAAEHSGLVELIVMQGEAFRYSDFTFTPYAPFKLTESAEHTNIRRAMGPARPGLFMRDSVPQTPGLQAGETRYRKPETIKVDVGGMRAFRAIAAFRFALTGAR